MPIAFVVGQNDSSEKGYFITVKSAFFNYGLG